MNRPTIVLLLLFLGVIGLFPGLAVARHAQPRQWTANMRWRVAVDCAPDQPLTNAPLSIDDARQTDVQRAGSFRHRVKKSWVRRSRHKRNSTMRVIVLGVAGVLAFVLGIGFVGARQTVLGSILYPAGLIFIGIGLLLAVYVVVHLR